MSMKDALRAAGIEISPARDDDDLWHDAAVPGHIREAATPGEYLDKPRPGVILGDCSCGAEYEVPQGGDEYGALESAHREHVAGAFSGPEEDPEELDELDSSGIPEEYQNEPEGEE